MATKSYETIFCNGLLNMVREERGRREPGSRCFKCLAAYKAETVYLCSKWQIDPAQKACMWKSRPQPQYLTSEDRKKPTMDPSRNMKKKNTTQKARKNTCLERGAVSNCAECLGFINIYSIILNRQARLIYSFFGFPSSYPEPFTFSLPGIMNFLPCIHILVFKGGKRSLLTCWLVFVL